MFYLLSRKLIHKLLESYLIDNTNLALYNLLSNKYIITLSLSNHNRIIRIGDNVIIKCSIYKLKPYILYHELLHLYLWDNEFEIGSSLNIFLSSSSTSQYIIDLFDNLFIETISNSCDHLKMYPIFLKSKYNKCFFLPKENVNISKILLNLDKSKYSYDKKNFIRLFILILISTYYAEYDTDVKYVLSLIDIELYDIVNDFVNSLIRYEFYPNKSNIYNPSSSVSFFIYDLDNYLNK